MPRGKRESWDHEGIYIHGKRLIEEVGSYGHECSVPLLQLEILWQNSYCIVLLSS